MKPIRVYFDDPKIAPTGFYYTEAAYVALETQVGQLREALHDMRELSKRDGIRWGSANYNADSVLAATEPK